MNIINISSTIEITYSQKSFIEEVLFCGDDHHIMMEEDSFYWLSKQIPIFLINEDSMSKHEKESEYRYEQNPNRKPHTEWLGFYGRDSSGLFEHTPRIAICPERIASCVKNDEEFMFLLTKVIVHEFAHAKMDYRDENSKYRKKDKFWHWMEESMANQLTLKVFRDFTRGYRHNRYRKNAFRNVSWEYVLWDFIVDFIKHQPPEYALGYEIFDKRVRWWWIWRNHKDELGGQKRIKQKNNWLKYVQSNYQKIDEKKAEVLFDGLIKEQAEPNKKEDFKTVAPDEVGEEGITPTVPEKLSKLQDIPEDDTDDYEEIADTHIRPSHDDKKDEEEIITYDKDGVPSNYIGDKADYIELGPNPTQKEYLAFRNKYLNMRDENGHRYLFHGVSIEDPDYESFYISMMKIKARNPDEFDRIMAKQ